MDKLKEQLAPVLKHGFWIAVGLVTLIAVGTWWMATSTLEEQTTSWKNAIQTKYDAMNRLQGEASTHPNAISHKQMQGKIDELKNDVYKAWESQYERQKAIFVWPSQLLDETRAKFSPLHPIEPNVPFETPPEKEVFAHLRADYARYIAGRLDDLSAIIKAGKWKADFKEASGGPGGSYGGGDSFSMSSSGEGMMSDRSMYGAVAPGVSPNEPAPLVDWPQESQAALLNQIFPWRRKGDPKTLDVLYSQESLWILEAVLNVLAQVNGDARFNPPIKKLEQISLGKGASKLGGSLKGSAPTGGFPGSGGEFSGGGADMYGGGGGGDSYGGTNYDSGAGSSDASGGLVQAAVSVDPADKRYVDLKYEPIEATKLRSVLTATDGSPEDAYLVVAKRVPVKLRVVMDQRRIMDLLAACGNADLMIEIRQVRINSDASGAGGTSFGGGGSPMSGGGDSFGAAGEGALGGGMSGGSYGGGASTVAEATNDLPVDIYGVVYVYNPPDLKKLFIEKVDTSTKIEGDATAPGDQPAGEQPTNPAAPTTPPADTPPAGTETPPAATPPADGTTPPAANPNPVPPGGEPAATPGPAPAANPTAEPAGAPAAAPAAAGGEPAPAAAGGAAPPAAAPNP